MYLTQKQIETMRSWLSKTSKSVRQKSAFCSLFSDPTRLKILLILRQQKVVCVGDLARLLGVTISAVSHQLAKLEEMALVKNCKTGQNVCYSLKQEGHIFECLEEIGKRNHRINN